MPFQSGANKLIPLSAAAAQLLQLGNGPVSNDHARLANLPGPASTQATLRLARAEEPQREKGVPGAAIPLEDFDAPELSSGWTIKDTGVLKLPRETLRADSYPNTVVSGVRGNYFSTLSRREVRSAQSVDFGWTGRVEGPEFTVERDFINFNIGGGENPGKTGVTLEIKNPDGSWGKAQSTSGYGNTALIPDFFPVKNYQGATARLALEDQSAGNMGYVAIDSIEQSNQPRRLPQLSLKDVGISSKYADSAVCFTNDYERKNGRWIDLGVSERQLNKILNNLTKTFDSSAVAWRNDESVVQYGTRIKAITDKAVSAVISNPSSDLKDYALFWGANLMVGAKAPYAHEYAQKTGEERLALQQPSAVLKNRRSVCSGSVLLTKEACNKIFESCGSSSRCSAVRCYDFRDSTRDFNNKSCHVYICLELGKSIVPVYADPTRLQMDYKEVISRRLPTAERNFVIDPSRTPLGFSFFSATNFPVMLPSEVAYGDRQDRFPLVSLSRAEWVKDAMPTYDAIVKALKSGK